MSRNMHARSIRAVVLVIVVAAFAGRSFARVVGVEVVTRADVLNGKPWGKIGAYEKIVGRVYFAVDPQNPHNRQVVDLGKATRNSRGEVEFSADVYILRPKSGGNG